MKIVREDLGWKILSSSGRKSLDLHRIALQNGFRVSGISAALDCSERHLYNIFIRDVGLGPKQWLAQIRMWEARLRLQAGEDPNEIAINLGFSHIGCFRREFVRWYGLCPARYLQDMDRRRELLWMTK